MKSKEEEFIAVYGIPTIDIDKDAFVNDLNEVIAEAIAEHEQGKWEKYPDSKPERHHNNFWVTLRDGTMDTFGYWANGFGDRDGEVIAWQEMRRLYTPAPYREKEEICPKCQKPVSEHKHNCSERVKP